MEPSLGGGAHVATPASEMGGVPGHGDGGKRTEGSDSAASTASQGELGEDILHSTPLELEAKALAALQQGDYSKLAALTSSLATSSSPSEARPLSVRKARQWISTPERSRDRPATAPAHRPAAPPEVSVTGGRPNMAVTTGGGGKGWVTDEGSGAQAKNATGGRGEGELQEFGDSSGLSGGGGSSSSTASPWETSPTGSDGQAGTTISRDERASRPALAATPSTAPTAAAAGGGGPAHRSVEEGRLGVQGVSTRHAPDSDPAVASDMYGLATPLMSKGAAGGAAEDPALGGGLDIFSSALRMELDSRVEARMKASITPEKLELEKEALRSEMGAQAAKLRAELEIYKTREEMLVQHQAALEQQQALMAERLDTLSVMAAQAPPTPVVLKYPLDGSPHKRAANKIASPSSLQHDDIKQTDLANRSKLAPLSGSFAALAPLPPVGAPLETIGDGKPRLPLPVVGEDGGQQGDGKLVGPRSSGHETDVDGRGNGDVDVHVDGARVVEEGEGDGDGEGGGDAHVGLAEATDRDIATTSDAPAKVAVETDLGLLVEETPLKPGERDTRFTVLLDECVRHEGIVVRHDADFGDHGGNVDEVLRHARFKRWQHQYTPYSFEIFSIKNPLRAACIRFMEWSWFDRFILLAIAVNCALMAAEDVENQDPNEPTAVLLGHFTLAFQLIFSIEMLTKLIAMGLVLGENTYLRDGWNCLDAFIVFSGWLEYLPAGATGNTSMLRTFRLLRPLRALRAVGRFKDLRMLVELLISCIPMLVNVFGLISFIFFVFGILGVQLWQGYLRGRCYSQTDGVLQVGGEDQVCSDGIDPPGFVVCEAGYECMKLWWSPRFDIITFDHIGGAMIVIFQIMIQQQWTDIMYLVWDGYSFWTWPYFILLNLVGPMFSIQLFLVVVANRYSAAKQAQVEAENAAVSLYEVKIGIVTANLPRAKGGVVDPYVKVQVDDKFKRTRTLKNTSVPEWNEYFVFPVSSISSRCCIQMYSWQRTGPHEPLGTLFIPCGTLDEDEEGRDKWFELELPDGGSSEGILHVRAQWRRSDADEWSPLPEVGDEDMPEEEDAEDEDKTCLGTIAAGLKDFAEGSFLTNLTIFVIVLNMVSMAADHDCYLQTDDYCLEFKTVLELTNIIFTSFFAFEMVIKIVGLGIATYLKDTTNLFDMLIVLMSLVELPTGVESYLCYTGRLPQIIDPRAECERLQGDSGMSVLRSFRLVRVLRIGKLVRSFPQIQRQLKVITRTLGAVSSLVMLILMFILIFAILGMSLFGGVEIDSLSAFDSDNVPYFRPGAFTRVIDPGNPVMRTARMISYNSSHYNGAGTPDDPRRVAPYEMVYWGNEGTHPFWISHAEDVNPQYYDALSQTISEPMIVGIRPRNCFDSFFFACLTVFQLLTTSDLGDVMYPALRGTTQIATLYFVALVVIGNFMLFNLFVAIIITGFSETKAMLQKEERENQRMIEADKMKKAQSLAHSMSMGGGKQQSLASNKDKESWLEKKWHWLKKDVLKWSTGPMTPEELKNQALKKQASIASAGDDLWTSRDTSQYPWPRRISENKYFAIFILCVIFASSVALGAQRPSMPPLEREVWKWVNLGANYVFLFECSLKIYGVGFLKYLRSKWHQLDFFLVVTSIPDLVVDTIGLDSSQLRALTFLRVFRIFRALRPLRVISRAKGLKIVLSTISRAVKPVMNTVVIAICVFFVFGIMAVQLIGDTTSYCSDLYISNKADCNGLDDSGNLVEWRVRTMRYNWIGNAMLAMFILASQDNWQCAMYAATDATGRETGPYVDANPAVALYFIAFMIVGSFFVIQLFVGVFIDTFQTVTSETKALSRQATNTTDKSSMSMAGLSEPLSSWRLLFFDVVTMRQFDLTIAFFILFNVMVMASESYHPGGEMINFLGITDFFFNFVFGAEVCAKLWGLYPRQYLISRWNKFDFAVVMVSFFGIAIDLQGATIALNPTILRVLRIFRVFRILRAFRIFKALEGLQKLVRTLLRSLGAVGNLGALLLLLFFIIGILAVELFGTLCTTEFDPNVNPGMMDRCSLILPDRLVDAHATFEELGITLLTLFRICTSDNWSQIMDATMQEAPPRKYDFDTTISMVRSAITDYLATGNTTALDSARELLPRCQTEAELYALKDVVSCAYYDEFGRCPTTCGNMVASSMVFSFFLCLSNFILLNLVMAVLMQELQEAMQRSQKTQSSLSVLMSVSAAANKWAQKATGSEVGSVVSLNITPSKGSIEAPSPMEGALAAVKRKNSVAEGEGSRPSYN